MYEGELAHHSSQGMHCAFFSFVASGDHLFFFFLERLWSGGWSSWRECLSTFASARQVVLFWFQCAKRAFSFFFAFCFSLVGYFSVGSSSSACCILLYNKRNLLIASGCAGHFWTPCRISEYYIDAAQSVYVYQSEKKKNEKKANIYFSHFLLLLWICYGKTSAYFQVVD